MAYHVRAGAVTFLFALLGAAFPRAAAPFWAIALVVGAAWITTRPEAALPVLFAAWTIRLPLRAALDPEILAALPAPLEARLTPFSALPAGPGAGGGLHVAFGDLLFAPALAALLLRPRRAVVLPHPALLGVLGMYFAALALHAPPLFANAPPRAAAELAVRCYAAAAPVLLLALAPRRAGDLARGAMLAAACAVAGLVFPPVEGARTSGVAGGANALGGFFAPLSAFLSVTHPVAGLLAALPVVASESRAALAAGALGLLAAWALEKARPPSARATLVVALAFGLGAALSLPSSGLFERIALPPVRGAGLGVPFGLSTHGRLYAEAGWFGLGALAAGVVAFLSRAARCAPLLAAASAAAAVSLFHETARWPLYGLLFAAAFFPSPPAEPEAHRAGGSPNGDVEWRSVS